MLRTVDVVNMAQCLIIIKYENEDLLHYDTVHCSVKSRTLKMNSQHVDMYRE